MSSPGATSAPYAKNTDIPHRNRRGSSAQQAANPAVHASVIWRAREANDKEKEEERVGREAWGGRRKATAADSVCRVVERPLFNFRLFCSFQLMLREINTDIHVEAAAAVVAAAAVAALYPSKVPQRINSNLGWWERRGKYLRPSSSDVEAVAGGCYRSEKEAWRPFSIAAV